MYKQNNSGIAVKAVVLDMDGLMLDTEPIYKRAMQKSAGELGYTLTDDFMLTLVGRPDSDTRRLIAKQLGDEFPLDVFRERWPHIWKDIAASEGIDQKPGLTELLSDLSEADLPVAIATSTYREQAEFTLEKGKISYPFKHIVTGDMVDHGKPAPDIFLEAARRLDVDPKHCIALEDSENGVRAASVAGMATIMVPDLISPTDEIRARAYRVEASLHEVREVISGMLKLA